jgi:hypothetical protein
MAYQIELLKKRLPVNRIIQLSNVCKSFVIKGESIFGTHTGWNVLRALTTLKKRGIRDFAALAEALRHRFAGLAWSTSCDTRRNVARGILGALKLRISLRLPGRKQLLAA